MAQRTLLLEENPLVIQPSLAVALKGLNEAIVLQQVHYWLNNSKHCINNIKWIYNSMSEWNKQFPFWSRNTVSRAFKNLIDKGVLITENFNQTRVDKTLWYTIDYEVLEKLVEESFNKSSNNENNSKNADEDNKKDNEKANEKLDDIKADEKEKTASEEDEIPLTQNGCMESENVHVPFTQNGVTITPKLVNHSPNFGEPIPETTTETNFSLSYISQSSLSSHNKRQDRQERPCETESLKQDFEDIVKQCDLEVVCKNTEASIVKQALQNLFYNAKVVKNSFGITLELMREQLKNLNPDIVKYALEKMQREIACGKEIRKPIAYLQSCIYNSIAEYQANMTINDQTLAQQALYKQNTEKKGNEQRDKRSSENTSKQEFISKFRGSDLEKPMEELSEDIPHTAIKQYFTDMQIKIDKKARLLELIVSDEFTAGIIESRYKNKVLEKLTNHGMAVDKVEVVLECSA